MKTIKVIDLLNKIANAEEVPKKIKYKTWTFIYVDEFYGYMKKNYLEIACNEVISFMAYIVSMEELNDEVEIVEEKKLPEKIDLTGYWDKNSLRTEEWCFSEELIGVKINEILDYLESKEKGE